MTLSEEQITHRLHQALCCIHEAINRVPWDGSKESRDFINAAYSWVASVHCRVPDQREVIARDAEEQTTELSWKYCNGAPPGTKQARKTP